MTKTVFISGQSNAIGRGVGGPNWSGISSLVKVWNNANPLGANGTAFVTPVLGSSTFDPSDGNNFGVWFANRLARHLSEAVNMAMVARGNTAISGWAPGDIVGMLQECIDVWAATGQGPADIFLWHQGEANTGTSYSTYNTAFQALLTNLTAAGVVNANTLVILGGLSEDTTARRDFNENVLKQIAANYARVQFARSDGLVSFDGTHFDGMSLFDFGNTRYFDAWMKVQQAMTVYVWANDGGTPGSPGTGTNKLANLSRLLDEGYRLKGVPVTITVSGTYTTPADVVGLLVELVGGGGGAGGADFTGGYARPSPGGGGATYSRKFIASPSATYTVTIGSAGSGGAAGSNNGGNGSSSSFGGVVTAPGGAAGVASPASTADAWMQQGGSGGGAGGGADLTIPGDQGMEALKLTAAARRAGRGGSSPLGRSGVAVTAGSTGTSGAGGAGSGYGAGGSGAVSSTTVSAAGADGMPGVVIVWEFVRA